MTDRKEALIALRDAVKSAEIKHYHWSILAGAFPQHAWSAVKSAYHGSLDAAIVLIVVEMPDEGWEVYRTAKYPGMIPGSSQYPYAAKVGWGVTFKGEADTPARALLLAILEALIAKEGEGHD